MKNFKVKAWDKRNGKWVEPGLFAINNGLLYEDWRDFEDGINFPEGEVELILFTGLKDVKENEIYEGDIVEQSFTELGSTERIFDNPPDDMTSFIGEVKIYDGSWWIDSGSWAIPLFSELNPNEVIGNRFDSAEETGGRTQ